jgi:hypothetical protein
VGRKSRRAQDITNVFGQIAPDLSRSVRVASIEGCMRTELGIEAHLGQCRPHGAAQIRRGLLVEQAMPWVRRDFRPTNSTAHHPRWAVPRSILAL